MKYGEKNIFIIDNVIKQLAKRASSGKGTLLFKLTLGIYISRRFWLKRTFECDGLHTEVYSILPNSVKRERTEALLLSMELWSVYDFPTEYLLRHRVSSFINISQRILYLSNFCGIQKFTFTCFHVRELEAERLKFTRLKQSTSLIVQVSAVLHFRKVLALLLSNANVRLVKFESFIS